MEQVPFVAPLLLDSQTDALGQLIGKAQVVVIDVGALRPSTLNQRNI
jgi:hypothetical protein